ncbi:hypothetical protein [Flavobacterium sp. W22_SRS_FP1]|uniref:hypothetical protein n=1 Tax=Flavobacterium sp. W22_SRS_FP1 TaxID=3240276 RepID=UPI003F93C0AE
MRRFLHFTFLFIVSNYCQAQDLEFDGNSLLFQDANTGKSVLILQDSLIYMGSPLTKGEYKHTRYPGKLSRYIPYSMQGSTFLVHDGSGPVVEFRNDSIVACNSSPLFQNQFQSAKFVYENELYLFGGYGLFTYKNILTKYDAKNKDWTQIETFGDHSPEPRARFYSYQVNSNLYVFAGDEADPDDFPNYKKCDNTIWRLHLPTMTWHKMGQFDSSILSETKFTSFPANGKLYLMAQNKYSYILEIDIEQNTVRKFIGKNLIIPTQAYYDPKKNELVCINEISNSNHRYKLFQANLTAFLGKPLQQAEFVLPFYKEINGASVGIGIGILLILFIIAFYIKKHNKNGQLRFNGIVFNKEMGKCYYKNRLIDSLDELELRVLLYLIENEIQFVPLVELNHLFENKNNSENYMLIVKKRQLSLASLSKKLSTLSSVPEKEIFLDRKNPEDKRIKEIKISTSFLKIK